MGLVYKRSTEKAARSYERSRGMEPNPGVTALTVVNPGKRKIRDNPFQWIQGKGQRHRHMSPPYKTVSGASKWKGRGKSAARLYPIDEHGTIVSRSVSKRLLTTNRRTGMAYNIGALRRAMRSNMSAADREAVKAAARGIDAPRRRRKSKSRKASGGAVVGFAAARHRRKSSRAHARASAIRGATSGRRRGRRKAAAIPGRGGVAVSGPGRKRRRSKRKSGSKRSRRAAARRSSKRRSSKRRSSKRGRARARRRSRRAQASKRRSSRRRSSKRRSSRRASRRRKTRRGGRRRARATRRGGRRRSRSTKYRYGRRRVRLTGKEYIDKYLSHGYMPTVARVRRTSASRSGRSSIWSYPVSGGIGRLSKRKTSRRARGKRSYAIGAGHRGRRSRRMAANRRSRRNSRRRRSRRSRRNVHYALISNGRRRRRSRRRGSRRSRRRMTRNMLAASKVRWHGRGSHRAGRASGRLYQMVEFGSRSKSRKGRRMSGYPVLVPAHVSERAYVRKFRFGGAAKDAHSRARSRGYRERKRYPKRRITKNRRRSSMRKNRYVVTNRRRRSRRNSRRRSRRNIMYAAANPRRRRRRSRRNTRYATANRRRSRRNSRRRRSRRNIMYAAANRRRSRRRGSRRSRRNSRGRRSRRNIKAAAANRRRRGRRLRRNMFFGADLVNDVAIPVAAGTGGFVMARVISNGLANIEGIRNLLDAGKTAAEATNTKIVANLLSIVATLGLGTRVSIVRRHQGALITGMGLALTDRLLSKVTGDAAAYLSGIGEYVSSPMNGFGEYVNQPLSGLGAYVSDPAMGEYVNQPLSGMGETLYAAAGLGRMYAEGIDPANQGTVDGLMDVMEAAAGTSGLGEEADEDLARMWGRRQIGFESIETPTDVARVATRTLPFTREVPESLVTPEGRGYAGGLFARNLFSGMMGG